MSANWGKNIELSIFGESHGKAVGINIGNLPSGIAIDMDEIKREMSRRSPGNHLFSTPRKETDDIQILSGILDGYTTGAPICAIIENQDTRSNDYSLFKTHMRPNHSDYGAYVKYDGYNDVRGGGHFSGRLTAPIVFAGAIAKQILIKQNIFIGSHIKSIKHIEDVSFPLDITKEQLESLSKQQYPLIRLECLQEIETIIEDVKRKKDSVGGKIECAIIGLQAGIGDPFFDSLESKISSLIFSIPGVKGIHFGNENISNMYGSEASDQYYYDGDQVKTYQNHNGGIVGGISNGMPICFTVSLKPTSSIGLQQKTINVQTKENTTISIKGRHDPCIVFRALPVIEAVVAIALLDYLR